MTQWKWLGRGVSLGMVTANAGILLWSLLDSRAFPVLFLPATLCSGVTGGCLVFVWQTTSDW